MERQQVMRVLLEMDCIPSGMELFPAADEEQWALIKEVINDCDYYIVIIGGRYGSTGLDRIGFTEKEYRYAVEQGKPVIAFLHGAPDTIQQGSAEDTDEGKRKLRAFRELAKQKMCKTWTTAHELGAEVVMSLNRLKRVSPGIGWIRGDQVQDLGDVGEILRLREKIEDLEAELARAKTSVPAGTENLAQGEDKFDVKFILTFKQSGRPFNEVTAQCGFPITWDDLFNCIAPLMIHESEESAMKRSLSALLPVESIAKVRQSILNVTSKGVAVESDCFQTIIVQLRALGLITKSTRTRSVYDSAAYWTLTPYGEAVMSNLRAITRTSRKEPRE